MHRRTRAPHERGSGCRGGWAGAKSGDRSLLHRNALAQHRHLVDHTANHSQVMAYEQQSHAQITHQFVQQPKHFGLRRHIERCRRLVRNQQLRPASQRHGNRDALPLTAGNLMRIGPRDPFRTAAAPRAPAVQGRRALRSACRSPDGDSGGRSGSSTWRPSRISGSSAVSGSWKITALATPRCRDSVRSSAPTTCVPVQHDRATDIHGARQEASDGQRGQGLARPGFPDQTHAPARGDGERDVRAPAALPPAVMVSSSTESRLIAAPGVSDRRRRATHRRRG